MPFSWTEIHLVCKGEDALAVSDQLQLLGAKAVTFNDGEDQPIYEPDPQKIALWDKTVVVGLFQKEEVTDALVDYLKQLGNMTLHELENKDWVRQSLSQFQPIQFGNKVWVCPTWIAPPDPSAINVLLDPGLAFGTGKHPTTSLCIEWLVKNFSHEKLVIDYGCGSGILGITAFKLGAKKIYFVDHDEQALIATQSNASLNHIPDFAMVTCFPKKMPVIEADLLIANILAQPIIALAQHFLKLIKPQGKILLSGILENQWEEVKNAFQGKIHFEAPIAQEGWVCVSGCSVDNVNQA